jgi:hypothetical protein
MGKVNYREKFEESEKSRQEAEKQVEALKAKIAIVLSILKGE